MRLPSARLSFLLIFVVCTASILIALYMEHVMGLIPCPLCITQRVLIIAVGVTALLAFAFNARGLGRRIFAAVGVLLAVAGGFFASRQLWLQSLPEGQAPACGPDVGYLLENFGLWDALSVLLRGDGNCAEVDWTLLGVSLAGWTLLLFVALAIANLVQLFRRH